MMDFLRAFAPTAMFLAIFVMLYGISGYLRRINEQLHMLIKLRTQEVELQTARLDIVNDFIASRDEAADG
jgi:hypothetical protein